MAKLPIKTVAQRKLDEAIEKLKQTGKLKKKKKKNGNNNNSDSKSNDT